MRAYSASLEQPLRTSNRTSIWTSALFAFSEGSTLFVVALTFWYGALLVSHREGSIFEFFVVLMVGFTPRTCPIHVDYSSRVLYSAPPRQAPHSPIPQIYLPPSLPQLISSNFSTLPLKLISTPTKDTSFLQQKCEVTFGLTMFISAILRDLAFLSFVAYHSRLSQAPMLH